QQGSGNITISVSPSLLLANGADTSVVTITVRDALGQPVADGINIWITAGEKFEDIDSNGYWTSNVDSLIFDANANGQWDALGLIPAAAVTAGGTGSATVNYVSGNDAMTVYLVATVNDGGIKGNSEVQLQVAPDATVASIYLASDSMQLSVKTTGGVESGILRATCYDINGNRVPEGIPVSFIIVDGPGGGEHLGNVGYGPLNAVTNSQGEAQASIHSGTVSGTVNIRASSDTILSNATQVLISAGPPVYIVVGASEVCNVPYWDVVAAEVGVVAVVSDIYLNPVNDSTVVYFSTDEGTMKSHEERTKDHEGIAHSKWISGNNVPTADGIVMVYAETAGGTVADTSFFINSHVPVNIFSNNMPASMPADNDSKVFVDVIGLDLNGNFVIGGIKLNGRAGILGVSSGVLENGCTSSEVEITINSNTLSKDKSLTGANDDGIGAIDVVTFSSPGGGSVSYNVTITTDDAYLQNCVLTAQATAFPGEIVNISVLIKDRFNNPLGDHTLIMTATAGTVANGTQETNAYGEASGFLWTAPGAATTLTISVQDTDPRGGFTFTQGVDVQ
ncbi:MAG: hypothetical protein IIA17_09695, partial [candidate division Zixibacteria bacterium]|nr:hypothetical protein [candidate division Zixibacteria bacterium]